MTPSTDAYTSNPKNAPRFMISAWTSNEVKGSFAFVNVIVDALVKLKGIFPP